MRNILLSLILSICVYANGQQTPVNTLWHDDAWIEGALTAEAYHGDVAGATVADASGYRRDNVEWIFGDISSRLRDLESTAVTEGELTIRFMGNNLYEFYEWFSEAKSSWYIPFPENKGITTVGMTFIGGFPFHSLGEVQYGYGGIQDGIQYSLAEGETWDQGTFAIGRFILQDAVAMEFVIGASMDVAIPSTLSNERLGLLEY